MNPRLGARCSALFLLLFFARPARAILEHHDSQWPLATSAGLAGADRATSARPDAGALNPAALLPGEDAWLGFSGGNGGSQADGSAAAYLTLPLLDDLSTALAWSTVLGSAGPGFMEQNLGLGAGLALSPGWSLGLRGSWHSIRDQLGLSSGAQGFSADAGLRYERALNRTHKLGLGYWGTQLASEWSDPRWKRTVPQVHHLGASWTWKRLASLHLGYELTQGSAVAQSGEEVEVGLASEAWKRFQARAGVALGARGARFGAGASQAWRGKRWRATGHLGAFRQSEDWLVRLQVDLGLTVRKQSAVLAMPLQLTYEPGTRRVQSATLAVNSLEVRPDAQEWELEIRDKDGRVIRVLRGTGTPPALITWDGRDALGEAVEDGDEVTYKLSIKTPNSVQSQTFDLDLRGGLDDSSLSELGADDGPLAEPLLDGEGKLFALLIRPPNLGPDTQRWELIVLDKGRQELYRSEGAGPFPPKLQWNGKDKQGRDRLHEAGLRLRFNAYDSQGRLSTTETELNAGLQPLEEEADAPLPRLGLRIAAFREGGPALALMGSDSSLALLPEEADPGLEATPQATPEPTPEPSAGPAPEPAPEPLLNEPTPLSSPEPTVLASVEPTPQPKATEEAAAAPALAAGLTAPKLEVAPALPPAFMTRAQAEGTSSQKPRPRSGRRAIKRPPLDTLLDIFKPNSAVVDEAKASDKLQAFYWRLQPYKARRLLLTGLVGPGEDGGEALSRQRVRALSQLMVEEGGFEGEFILKVNGSAGQEKGVRVEVLKR